MSIKIAQKIKPFSHTAGSGCIIPGSCSTLYAFPTLLQIDHHRIPLNITGPVHDFTLLQDLEKNCVFVYGKAKEGYFRLQIVAKDFGFEIIAEKGPIQSRKILSEIAYCPLKPVEKLSLGSHKAQDWDLALKRFDLKEILPTLFYLGQKVPFIAPQPLLGTARLLQMPKEKKELSNAIRSFCMASFHKILVPRLFDDQHQGFIKDEPVEGNPYFLLQEGAKLIRSLFFQQSGNTLSFLPQLIAECDAGRMIRVNALNIGLIDFEWSKKTLRRVKIFPNVSKEITLNLQKEIKSYRVNKTVKCQVAEPLYLQENQPILLDRFEK